jgi:hypothetical protein
MSRLDALISTADVMVRIALNFWLVIVALCVWAIVVAFMGRGGRE